MRTAATRIMAMLWTYKVVLRVVWAQAILTLFWMTVNAATAPRIAIEPAISRMNLTFSFAVNVSRVRFLRSMSICKLCRAKYAPVSSSYSKHQVLSYRNTQNMMKLRYRKRRSNPCPGNSFIMDGLITSAPRRALIGILRILDKLTYCNLQGQSKMRKLWHLR